MQDDLSQPQQAPVRPTCGTPMFPGTACDQEWQQYRIQETAYNVWVNQHNRELVTKLNSQISGLTAQTSSLTAQVSDLQRQLGQSVIKGQQDSATAFFGGLFIGAIVVMIAVAVIRRFHRGTQASAASA